MCVLYEVCFDQCMLFCSSLTEIVADDLFQGEQRERDKLHDKYVR